MPLAAFVTEDSGGALRLNAAWGDPAISEAPSGSSAVLPMPLVQVQQTAVVCSFDEAEALGEAVAAQLRAGGAVWASNAPAA